MTQPELPDTKGQPGATRAALFALCPRCGAKGLFKGLTQFAGNCPKCGLDYAKFNVGDGPAAFPTLIIGAGVATLAILVELRFEPPFWVHAVLWIPLTSAAVLWGLRAAKAALLGAEFRRSAGQGKLRDRE